MMVRIADHDRDIQLVAVAAWQQRHRREKGTEALGPVIDLVFFEFQNMTMTPLMTIGGIFGEFPNDEES